MTGVEEQGGRRGRGGGGADIGREGGREGGTRFKMKPVGTTAAAVMEATATATAVVDAADAAGRERKSSHKGHHVGHNGGHGTHGGHGGCGGHGNHGGHGGYGNHGGHAVMHDNRGGVKGCRRTWRGEGHRFSTALLHLRRAAFPVPRETSMVA